MKKMSTGQDSTLGNWIKMVQLVFGKDSKAIDFLEKKVLESPNGRNEEIIADEGQLLHVLLGMHTEGLRENEKSKEELK